MVEDKIFEYVAEQRELYGSLFNKALRFLEFDCIRYIGGEHDFSGEGKAYLILPLNTQAFTLFRGVEFSKLPYKVDYNWTCYVVTVTYDKIFKHNYLHCSCQGWKSKVDKGEHTPDGVNCSHALALKLFWKRQSFEREFNKELEG
jgi:hypothetical protein